MATLLWTISTPPPLPHVLWAAQPHQGANDKANNDGPIAVGEVIVPSTDAQHDMLEILGCHDNAGHSQSKDAQIQKHRYQQANIGSKGEFRKSSIRIVALLQYRRIQILRHGPALGEQKRRVHLQEDNGEHQQDTKITEMH